VAQSDTERRGHAGEAGQPAPETHPHPSPRQYIKVAVILAIITAAEVGLYYIDLPNNPLIGLLVAFSALKFALVVLWFMHLRFDSPILKRLFVTGLILAGTVYAIVLVIFVFNRKSGTVIGG
jgi:cytochrome c oxidase subunit IV